MNHHTYHHDDEVMGKAFDLRLMRRLLTFLRPYRPLFAVCVVLTLVLAAVQLSIPYFAKVEIDTYLTLSRAVVAVDEAPDQGLLLTLEPGRHLVDLGRVDAATRRAWETSGNLEQDRYVFVPSGNETARLVQDHPGVFVSVDGGYVVAQSDLSQLPRGAVGRVRSDAVSGILLIASVLGAALLLQFVAGVGQVYLLQYTGQKVMYDMRRAIFDHVLRLPVRYFDRTPVGRLVTRVTNDVQAINEMFTSMLVNLFRDGFLLVGITVVMLQLDWRLALVVIALFPLIAFAALKFRNRVRVAYREVRKRIAELNAYLQESISGMRIIQLFVQEAEANRKFTEINERKYEANMKQLLTFAVFRPLMSFLSSFAIALVIWYGGRGVLREVLSLGALTAFIHYVRMLFDPVLRLSEGYNVLQAAMASSERIFLLLDEDEEDRGGDRTATDIRGRVEFRDVWFAYDEEEWVLRGVSFTVDAGQRLAIVGPTGSGKTTIIRLLLRMYPVQRGQILLDGVPIEAYDLAFLRSQMAVVLQDVFLFSGTILDNIRLRSDMPETKAVEAARFANADFVEEFADGYSAEVKERGATLSVGERQLLSFARAVAFDPRILVLDEATASIDSHTESLVQQSLHRIMEGRTSIAIAHRLSTIREASTILVLSKGQIVEQGTHVELLRADGLYAALYAVQFAERFAQQSEALN